MHGGAAGASRRSVVCGGGGLGQLARAMQAPVERPTPAERPAKSNDGSLLRLFRSSYFDPWMAFLYIYRHPQAGVVDYISNHLYSFSDTDIEFYLPQLCHLLIHVLPEHSSLERFLVDKCLQSPHFALKATWWLRSYLEEADPALKKRLELLIADCEYAAIQQKRLDRRTRAPSPQPPKNPPKTSVSASASLPDTSAVPVPTAGATSLQVAKTDVTRSEGDLPVVENLIQPDQSRSERFESMAWFVTELGALSERLRRVAVPQRAQRLQEEIATLNGVLFAPLGQSLQSISAAQGAGTPRAATFVPAPSVDGSLAPLPLPPSRGLYVPLWSPGQQPHLIIHIPSSESLVLNSRERVPYIVYLEAIDTNAAAVASNGTHPPHTPPPLSNSAQQQADVAQQDAVRVELANLMAHVQKYETTELQAPPAKEAASADVVAGSNASHERSHSLDGKSHSAFNSTPDDSVSAVLPFGETIEVRTERVRKNSPYGHHAGWRLLACIVKSGDELRQEQLATQLIAIFRDIFAQNKLPLFLRPYTILVTSAKSGLIEAIPNIVSLHQLHKMSSLTLAEYFRKSYGGDTHKYKLAQRNFSESLAGYSLLTYILQVKDRHNGNILLDNEGHIVHIDFGFMLSNSPGSLAFETAPFKLTQEFVDVLDGVLSAPFQYFRALCIRGFLELRKHHERIVALTEMMSKGSKLPCFYGGQVALDALRDRFQSSLTEDEFIKHVDGLIAASLDSWTTRQYDRYQYLTNSIW